MRVKKQLEKMAIGEIRDVIYSNGVSKSTKELERVGPNKFYIHDFSNGWLMASLNLKEAVKYVKGKINALDINWV